MEPAENGRNFRAFSGIFFDLMIAIIPQIPYNGKDSGAKWMKIDESGAR
ncbi:MAG: hypothetical protein KH420_03130 [Clostridiales bacterium]|nr:hypothetical protein [Clostridiales bacterium]